METIIDSLERRIDNRFAIQVGFEGSAFISVDDNFMSQAYTQDIGFNLNLRFGIKEFFGLGFNFNRYELSNDDSRFLGSIFPTSRFYSTSIFGYYQHLLFKNLTGEIKVGIFNSNLKNRSTPNSSLPPIIDGNLRLNFSGFLSGLNFIHYLGSEKKVGISLGADLYFTMSDKVQTAPSEQDFINKNSFTTINLGMVIGN